MQAVGNGGKMARINWRDPSFNALSARTKRVSGTADEWIAQICNENKKPALVYLWQFSRKEREAECVLEDIVVV